MATKKKAVPKTAAWTRKEGKMKPQPGMFDDLDNLPKKNGKIDWSLFEKAARKDLKKSKKKIEKQEDVDPYA